MPASVRLEGDSPFEEPVQRQHSRLQSPLHRAHYDPADVELQLVRQDRKQLRSQLPALGLTVLRKRRIREKPIPYGRLVQ